jgi:hypothetical protein
MTRGFLVVLLIIAVAAPARAQLAVIDPANLVQTILTAERTLSEYETLVSQYQTIVRMARGIGSLDRYRIPTIGSEPGFAAAGNLVQYGPNLSETCRRARD